MEQIPAIESVFAFATRWPIVISIVVAGAAAWFLTLVLERYFLPIAHDSNTLRHQKGATFIGNATVAAFFTTILWDAFVPEVPLLTRLGVSFVAGIVTAFVYPILAKLATARWPAIGSAWAPRE